MPHNTGDWALSPSPNVTLTVRSSTWRYLEKWVDPKKEALLLVWGIYGDQPDASWMISILPHDELPRSQDKRPLRSSLEEYELLVMQPQHVSKLNGRSMLYEAGQLIIA